MPMHLDTSLTDKSEATVRWFTFRSASLLALTGSASATEGNYSIVEETDEAGTTYLTTKPMELDGGNWQEDVNGIPTLWILLMVP